MAELVILPFQLDRFVPRGKFVPEDAARALLPILARDRQEAARWWTAHISRARASMTRRGIASQVQAAWITSYTHAVRLQIVILRPRAPDVDHVASDA